MKRLLILSILILTAACTTYTDTTRFDGEEEKPAHIRGIVTRIDGTLLTVEADPDDATDPVKGTVTLAGSTEFQRADKTATALSDVRLGSLVSVWFEGDAPVQFPVQGTAARLRIER